MPRETVFRVLLGQALDLTFEQGVVGERVER